MHIRHFTTNDSWFLCELCSKTWTCN